ncbi:hypothetical protein KVR01_013598 [Diaporthe batatas]|uniref:uncharacterized protein n=1 Tax=Diaporthe batatas TaxID=748121 RepID=UPI001D04C4B5|nr:uncharacterized protein KVR01_013598 [Diaporthe batatas]KAG8156494.1 hypothetical protein KVR01_013598 [Diaporthe batatas]
MAEFQARLGDMERNAGAALALAIIAILVEVVMMTFIFRHGRQRDRGQRSVDVERGLDFQDTNRHQPQDPPLAAPAPTRSRNPVGHSPADALGRPVAAYESQGDELHGEADDYYNPSPISKRPTYDVGSGMGAQTHGTDYTRHRRQSSGDGPRTNRNDADYGRKGNKFAHGT